MQITAQKRENFGKKNKALRRENMLPGVVMEKANPSVSVVLSSIEFGKVYREAGETTLIDFLISDASYKVLISEVQLHPVTLKPIHAAFRKVNLKEKISGNAKISIKTIAKIRPLILL